MKIAISGSSGFIGKHLSRFLKERGDEVIPLTHSMFDNPDITLLKDALQGVDVVVNLAGTPINQRWTPAIKADILNSRVSVTRTLVNIINQMENKPTVFISASAIGIYPDDGVYSESAASVGMTYLAEVCTLWEDEAQKVSPDVRLAITRFGIVLANDGGVLSKMLPPFQWFVGGKIASGEQIFCWIHIDDLVNAIQFIITHKDLSGIINLVSPNPLTNEAFTTELAAVLHRPSWFTVPSFVLKLIYGEGEQIATIGQQAYPSRLLTAGYTFRYADIRQALRSLFL